VGRRITLSVPEKARHNKKLKGVTMENPFDSPSPFAEAAKVTETPKPNLVDAKDMLGVARSLESQARLAQKTKNWVWMEKIKSLAQQLVKMLWGFIKEAFKICVFSFILEICNRVLASATEGLSKHKLQVTTPTQGSSYEDPFARRYGTSMSW
jgi:hypothetical protein